MKTLLTLLITFISFAASAQVNADTTVIVEYRLFNEKWYGIDSAGNFHRIDGINYRQDPLPSPIVNYQVPARSPEQLQKFKEDVVNRNPVLKPKALQEQLENINHAVRINRAGKLFIASGVLIIAGGVVTGVGIATDIQELPYVGAAAYGLSVFTTIAAGVQLYKFKFPKSEMTVSAGAIKMNF